MTTIRHLTVEVTEDVVEGWGRVTRLRVKKTSGKDGITWDQLQMAKAEAGFADCRAIEIYPRECDVVNEINMRHLFIVPEEIQIPDLTDLGCVPTRPPRNGCLRIPSK